MNISKMIIKEATELICKYFDDNNVLKEQLKIINRKVKDRIRINQTLQEKK